MWKNHPRVFGEHTRCIMNDITKNFKVIIFKYYECVHEMIEIGFYLPSTSNKGEEFTNTDWKDCNTHFSEKVIHKAIKNVFTTMIKEKTKDKDTYYH